MPTKSPNEEVFSTSELEEENKERKRSEDQPVKQEGVWIPQKVDKGTPSWKIYERDEKLCSFRNWSLLVDKLLLHAKYNQSDGFIHQTKWIEALLDWSNFLL